jgi:hypothetical protein
VLDDFSTLTSHANGSARTRSERRADKGHAALLDGVLAAVRGERAFEPGLGAAYAAQSVALGALESLAAGGGVEVTLPAPGG